MFSFLFSSAEVNYGSDAVPGKQQELTRLLWEGWLRLYDRRKHTKLCCASGFCLFSETPLMSSVLMLDSNVDG